MEIIKNEEDGLDYIAIKAKVSIEHTALFNDALIFISVNEFTECLEAVLSAKIADRKLNPFWKITNPNIIPK